MEGERIYRKLARSRGKLGPLDLAKMELKSKMDRLLAAKE